MKVCSDVPERWDGKIRKAMEIEGWDTVSAYYCWRGDESPPCKVVYRLRWLK